jgi:hypothetical protein
MIPKPFPSASTFGFNQARVVSVNGEAPFEITIGDANHVDILVNGKFVSPEPYMRRDNTARFTVESVMSLR